MTLDIESMFARDSGSFETGRAVKTYLVPLEKIFPGENNFYSTDPAGIEALAGLIEATGLIHPLSAVQAGDGARIVSGERRYRAMKLLAEEGRRYSFNGRDITGRAPVTYMPDVSGSREKLAIAAANASRDLTNAEKDMIIDEVTQAIENEVRKGNFEWPKGKKAHTLSVYTGIREHYIKDFLAKKAKKEEEPDIENRNYKKVMRFLASAEKRIGETKKMMKEGLTESQRQEIIRKTALLCTQLEDLLAEGDAQQ